MVESYDLRLLEKYNELQKAGSMKVTILRDQVDEIVVAELISKYKECKNQDNEYKEGFAKVLRFYLTEDELKEFECLIS